MSRLKQLKEIDKKIRKALKKYNKDGEWQSFDTALVNLCSPIDNRTIRTVLPKVVAVDRLYKADLIRYLPKPKEGEEDYRPSRYVRIAKEIAATGLEDQFISLQKKSRSLDIDCLDQVTAIHSIIAETVMSSTGRNGEVFASKFLHFCRQDYFPIIDKWAEDTTGWILDLKVPEGDHVISDRFGYDEADGKYSRFCRAALAIQSALADAGYGNYSLAELDKYLYG